MQMGMIGLGRMGGNIVRRLMAHGHSCVVYDRDTHPVEELVTEKAIGADGLEDMVKKLEAPRVVWVMLPAGRITDETVTKLGEIMSKGDIIIDGGNSFWQDDIRRAKALAEKGIRYVDVGTSGGVWGRERGYCMMIGGDKDAVDHIDPILGTLAPGMGSIERTTDRPANADTRPERGYMHCGRSGAGHFVKMVHNGIEYGLMQAYAEGFDILKNADTGALPPEQQFEFNLADIAEVWRRGSVVSSWLLDLTALSLAKDPALEGFVGSVQDSGEGRWTIQAAINEAVPADVLSAALYTRFRSRQTHTFAEKLLSAMRNQFGGHIETH